MARAYHNLDGLLRDAESAYRSDDAEGQQRWSRLVDVIEWALDHIEGPGAVDDAEDGDADAEDDVDGVLAEPRVSSFVGARGPDEGSPPGGAPASKLDAVLDRLAGPERAQAIAELDSLRRDAVAGTQSGTRLSKRPS